MTRGAEKRFLAYIEHFSVEDGSQQVKKDKSNEQSFVKPLSGHTMLNYCHACCVRVLWNNHIYELFFVELLL